MWWVIETSTEKLLASFSDQSCQIGPDQQWLEVPEGLVRGNVKVQNTEGVLSLVEDTSKSNANPFWKILRDERDRRLTVCDWTQLADSPLSSEQKATWAVYRQALRDIPANTSDPEQVVWPTQP